jgi:NMD protein affecting ribosome stability and mRNA decay
MVFLTRKKSIFDKKKKVIYMEMFDWVKFRVPCPKCGREVENFQSKDGDCLLEELDFWQVDNFYSYCDNCEATINYTLNNDIREKIRTIIENIRKALTIKDYDLEFRDKEFRDKEFLAVMIMKKLAETDAKADEEDDDTDFEEIGKQECDGTCDNCNKL